MLCATMDTLIPYSNIMYPFRKTNGAWRCTHCAYHERSDWLAEKNFLCEYFSSYYLFVYHISVKWTSDANYSWFNHSFESVLSFRWTGRTHLDSSLTESYSFAPASGRKLIVAWGKNTTKLDKNAPAQLTESITAVANKVKWKVLIAALHLELIILHYISF